MSDRRHRLYQSGRACSLGRNKAAACVGFEKRFGSRAGKHLACCNMRATLIWLDWALFHLLVAIIQISLYFTLTHTHTREAKLSFSVSNVRSKKEII